MKQLLIYASLLLVLSVGITGCYKDVILPEAVADPDGPAQFVSFKEQLLPLVNAKCGLSGCHVTGAHKPYLGPTNAAYQEIINGGFVNLMVPKESIIYKMINGEMKEYIPSATDRQKIYDWIRNGAPNN